MSRHIRKSQHPNATTDAIEAGARQVADTGSEMYATAIAQSKSAVKMVEKYIHQNPWYAVGAAGGIGVLLGLMLRRS